MHAFTALTAVLPAREDALAASLAALPEGDESPFARMPSTHFARFVVLDREATRPSRRHGSPPLLQHLLLTTTSNSPAAEHVEELRRCLGPLADAIWGQCVGYPGRADARRFRRYLLHNRLRVPLVYRAYDATVSQVREALDLRERHLALARTADLWDDEALQDQFRAAFPG